MAFLPVLARQSLMAASTASAPLLVKVTYLRPRGATSMSLLASSLGASRFDGCTKLGSPISLTLAKASQISGGLKPKGKAP